MKCNIPSVNGKHPKNSLPKKVVFKRDNRAGHVRKNGNEIPKGVIITDTVKKVTKLFSYTIFSNEALWGMAETDTNPL
ncbi:hypothetical protein [Maribacter polysiphoniae]|uniref:hypothetical protein n=1 Tax=Maribacter polysiphoniae TaxID=429344 RepID=UPI001476017A|nr:hypothetical protein [Maribacter polysiphoniae]